MTLPERSPVTGQTFLARASLVTVALARALGTVGAVVVAAVLDAEKAPTPVRAVVTGVAVVAVAILVSGADGRGRLDRVALVSGGVLTLLVLLGLVLDVAPGGIRDRSWIVGLGVIALAGVLAATRTALVGGGGGGGGGTAHRERLLRARELPWLFVALAVTAGALVISAVSAHHADRAPLELTVPADGGPGVIVSTGIPVAPLLLEVDSVGRPTVGPAFTVAPGASARVPVVVRPRTVTTVRLLDAGSRRVLRTVEMVSP